MTQDKKRDETLGATLRAHPGFKSMSQTALNLGRPLSEISRECGGWSRPNAKHRKQWAEYLGISEAVLFSDAPSPREQTCPRHISG